MAYVQKYHVYDKSRAGIDWTIKIYKNGATGTSTELTSVGSDGAIIRWEGEGDDLWNGIKASNLTMALTGTKVQMAAFVDMVVNAGTNDIIITVEKDEGSGDVFFWGGVLTHDVVEIPDKSKYIVQITAIDGLAGLQNINITRADFDILAGNSGLSYFGTGLYYSVSNIFETILKQLPWIGTVYTSGFAFKWVQNWYPDGLATDEWQNNIYLNINAFAKYNERTEQYDLDSLYSIIEKILDSFFSEIKLSNGLFVVICKDYYREFAGMDYIVLQGNTVIDNGTDSNVIAITQAADNFRLSGGRYVYKQPVKQAKKKITYQNSNANNNQTIYDAWQSIVCQRVGATATGTGDLSCEAVSSDDVAKFEIVYNFPFNAKLSVFVQLNVVVWLSLKVRIKNGTDTYYLSGSSDQSIATEWTTSSASRFYIISNPTNWNAAGGPGSPTETIYNGYFENSHLIDLPFTTGITETIFSIDFNTIFYTGSAQSPMANFSYFYAEFNNGDFFIKPKTTGNEETSGEVTFSETSANNNDLVVDLPDNILHDGGDATGLFFNNNVGAFSIVPGTVICTSKWYDRTVGDSVLYYLPDFVCRAFLNFTEKALKLYSGSFVNSAITPETLIQIIYDSTTETYVWNGMSFSLKRDKWTGELWKVGSVTLPATFTGTNVQVPAGGDSIARGAHSLPYSPGSTSGADDHFTLENFKLNWIEQTRNSVLAVPDDADGYPVFRQLLKFGDLPNNDFSEFEDNGFLKFTGGAKYFVDIDFPIIIRTTGANIPTLTTVRGNLTAPQWAINDYNNCEAQELIHGWEEASEITFHVHILTGGTNTDDRYVAFEVEYNYADINGVWLTNNVIQKADIRIPANTPILTHLIENIYSFSPAVGIGAHVWARLKRVAASTGTAPTTNPFCSMLQMHVDCDTIGSRNITSK